MQILHSGDLVRARRRRWRIEDVRAYETSRVVSLAGTGANRGRTCRLLSPFDAIEIIPEPDDSPKRVGRGRWRHSAGALLAVGGVPGLLRASLHADIDILPHQLEPAVAVLRGDGCRLLIADDVGLGKTIQACLLVAELRLRGAADRVLVLTPPGLRDQWNEELGRRFRIDAVVADFHAIRARAAAIAPGVNPWTTWPTVVASIDYVKRPEVLRAVLACRWDAVVVDEAHRVAGDGERRQAAAALTSRATYVVLLTATPHSGHSTTFRTLCDLGGHGDRLLIFRRTRRMLAQGAPRHVHRLAVRATAAERQMLRQFDVFAAAVRADRGRASRDAWIALSLLRKRAFSSAHSLHLSVTRRLDALIGRDSAMQLPLPLDEQGETTNADETPDWDGQLVLSDADDERRLLTSLASAAAAAVSSESKLKTLRRLLRRIREPLIVFTEYRDTLAHLARSVGEPAVLLHGGLMRAERAAAVDSFTRGRCRLLLATDAAAEGLNLHQTCRVVVNLELPWNPMRLEQRIGRVDRIGQARTVHAFHLIGRDTGERHLLDELRKHIANAKADIGAPDPIDGALDPDASDVEGIDAIDVSAELSRLRLARALPRSGGTCGRPLVARARGETRRRLGARTLLIWESTVEDDREFVASSRLTATFVDDAAGGLNAVIADCRPAVEAHCHEWQTAVVRTANAFAAAGIARTRAIAGARAGAGAAPMQAGLFDHRAHFAQAALSAAQSEQECAERDRIAEFQARLELRLTPPRLRLVLQP